MNKVKRLSPKAFEALSAYMDGQLNAEEAQKLEAQLSRSIELKQAYDRIKAMRSTVRALPQHKAPRNFILTRAEAAEAKRGRNWTRAFGFAFSMCMVFLVAVFGYGGLQNNLFMAKQAAPMAAESLMADTAVEAPHTEPETVSYGRSALNAEPTPVLITWGSPTGMGGGGDSSAMGGAKQTTDGLPMIYSSGEQIASADPADDLPEETKELEAAVQSANTSSNQKDAATESIPDALPLILGIDHENQGEVIAKSSLDEDTSAVDAETSSQPAALSGSPYNHETDHQTYFRDQLILWLKIGLASLGVLFGVIWLILRRK